jgi:hypothetical protein
VRRRNPRLLGLAVVVCLLAAGVTGSALDPGAVVAGPHKKVRPKKKPLPSRFFGVSPNRGLPTADEFARMKRGGIRSYRIPMGWSSIWGRSGRLNWGYFDVQVALAAQAGIDVLPVVYSTPAWLASDPRTIPINTAGQRAVWAAFLREAVKRYGPKGAFWKLHPTLPKLPIRAWQIWNEENSTWYTEPVSVSGYAKLLKISSKAIKKADRGAKVVTGGLYGRPKLPNTYYASGYLKRLYRIKGVKSSFDVLALHPYAADVRDMRSQITEIRTIMRNHGDKRTPLWLDEFGWGSGDGKTSYEKGPQGQKQMLVAAYKVLKANWRRWKISRTYWFSWDDVPANEPACFYCHSSGLFTSAGAPKPAWYGFVQVSRGKP